jgi:hypothetical protein
MATRRYLNFDLLLEQEGEGRYQARVTDSPLGETPSVRFQLPFDATTLENLLLKLVVNHPQVKTPVYAGLIFEFVFHSVYPF